MSYPSPDVFFYLDGKQVSYEEFINGARRIVDSEGACDHDWKDYVGFTNRFTYCEKCNCKKELFK
jgi:hypothetical protein